VSFQDLKSGLWPKGAPLRGLRSSPSGFDERSLRELEDRPIGARRAAAFGGF